jgi:hypothetical protein
VRGSGCRFTPGHSDTTIEKRTHERCRRDPVGSMAPSKSRLSARFLRAVSLSIVTRAQSSILWLCAWLSQRCIPSAWPSFSGHARWRFESEQLRLSRERDEPRTQTRCLVGSDSGPSIRVSRQRQVSMPLRRMVDDLHLRVSYIHNFTRLETF